MQIKDSLNYCGFATIKVKKGNKIIKKYSSHNSGTQYLFKLLANALCGNYQREYMPRYIDLGNIDENSKFTSSLIHRIPLNSTVVTENSGYSIELANNNVYSIKFGALFSCLFNFSNLIPDGSINAMQLHSNANGNDTCLAQIQLADELSEDTLKFSSSYNFLVEWIMTFDNALISSQTDNDNKD